MARLRPTSDRMREAIFNILAHGDYPALDDARVLDIFAGTGAMGIEALSRGAREATFIDNGREARDLLRQNTNSLGLKDRVRIMAVDIMRLTANTGAPFDIIFCDAPYGKGMTAPVLTMLAEGEWLTPDAVLVVETAADESLDLPPALHLANERRYGKGKIWLIRVADDATGDT